MNPRQQEVPLNPYYSGISKKITLKTKNKINKQKLGSNLQPIAKRCHFKIMGFRILFIEVNPIISTALQMQSALRKHFHNAYVIDVFHI